MKTIWTLVLGVALGAILAARVLLSVPIIANRGAPVTSPARQHDGDEVDYKSDAPVLPQLVVTVSGPELYAI